MIKVYGIREIAEGMFLLRNKSYHGGYFGQGVPMLYKSRGIAQGVITQYGNNNGGYQTRNKGWNKDVLEVVELELKEVG